MRGTIITIQSFLHIQHNVGISDNTKVLLSKCVFYLVDEVKTKLNKNILTSMSTFKVFKTTASLYDHHKNSSIQFSFIYIAPNDKCHLEELQKWNPIQAK